MNIATRPRALAPVAVLLGVLLLAAAAAAQSDVMCFCPEDDSDSDCGGNIDIPAFSQQTIYLCLQEPSESQVMGWQASIEVVGDENMMATWRVLGEEAINVGESETDFIVGVGMYPLTPNSGNMVPLASVTALVFNEDPIKFYIRPYPGSSDSPYAPAYASDVGNVIECTACGSDDFPSFTINWAAIDDARAWGEVKNLYED